MKSESKRINASNIESLPSVFPRGVSATKKATALGSSSLKRSRENSTQRDDALFGKSLAKRPLNRPKSSKKKLKSSSKSEEGPTEPLLSSDPSSFRIMTKNMTPGMAILGVVSKVNELNVIVNLPHGLEGSVPISEVSDVLSENVREFVEQDVNVEQASSLVPDLSDLIKVGTFVRVAVVSLRSTHVGREIDLTMRGSVLNRHLVDDRLICIREGFCFSGCIESVEDHGFEVDFGMSNGLKGFLHKRDAGSLSLKPGQPVQCRVKWYKPELLRVGVALNITEAPELGSDGIDFSALQVGLQVQATKVHENEYGVVASFMEVFRGFLHHSHAPTAEKQKFASRIISIDYDNRIVGLSSLEHVLAYSASHTNSEVTRGLVIRKAQVTGIIGNFAITLSTHYGPAVAYRNEALDESKSNNLLSKVFEVGQVLDSRVLSTDLLDGLIRVTVRPSAISEKFFSIDCIKSGMNVSGIVRSIKTSGILVELSEFITAYCHFSHLSDLDITLLDPLKHFEIGKTYKFKVLKVAGDAVMLTHKKSLMESNLPALTFSSLCKGKKTLSGDTLAEETTLKWENENVDGYITSITKKGIYIGFYDDLFGLVSARDLHSNGYLGDFSQYFFQGQVLTVSVVKAMLNKESSQDSPLVFILSMHTSKSMVLDPSNKTCSYSAGDSVKGIVEAVSNAEVVLLLDDGSMATLRRDQLTDFAQNSHGLWNLCKKAWKKGAEIEGVTVLCNSDRGVMLTAKPLFNKVCDQVLIPSSFDQVNQGDIVLGFVSSIVPSGVFIEFFQRCTAIVAYGANTPIISEGDTVLAQVCRTNAEKQQFSVQLFPVDKIDSLGFKISEICLPQFFRELQLIKRDSKHSNGVFGKVMSFFVKKKKGRAYDLVSEDGSINAVTTVKTEIVEGSMIDGQIIDVDTRGVSVVDVISSEILDTMQITPTKGAKIKAHVVFVSDDWYACRLENGCLARSYKRLYNFECFEDISVGKDFSGWVVQEGTDSQPTLIVADVFSFGTRGLPYPDSSISKDDFEHVEMTVSSIENDSILLKNSFSNRTGILHVSSIRNFEPSRTAFILSDEFKKGDLIFCSVIGTLPSSQTLELSCNPDVVTSVWRNTLQPNHIRPGDIHPVYISDFLSPEKTERLGFSVALAPHVQGKLSMYGYPIQELIDRGLVQYCSPEINSKCFVDASRFIGHSFKVTLLKPSAKSLSFIPYHMSNLESSTVIFSVISHANARSGYRIVLPGGQIGYVHVTDISDQFVKDPIQLYAVGDFVAAAFLGEDTIDGKSKYYFSLRNSRVMHQKVNEHEIVSEEDPRITEKGIVRGYVTSFHPKAGVFVSLNHMIVARMQFRNCFEQYKQIKPDDFPIGTPIKGRVIKVNKKNHQIEISQKPSHIREVDEQSFTSFTVGMPVKGVVESVTTFGVFIRIPGCPVTALCHRSQMTDEEDAIDPCEHYNVGDRVRGVILKADLLSKRIGVALKKSSVDSVTFSASDDEREEETAEIPMNKDVNVEIIQEKDLESEDDAMEVDWCVDHPKEFAEETASSTQFEDYIEDQKNQTLSQSINTCEMLIEKNPNSSEHWIEFMVLFSKISDIEKARNIASRAIDTIAFREESEKLKVWIALLELELTMGTPETFKSAFKKAIKLNNALDIYRKTIAMMEKRDKIPEANEIYKDMVKEFKLDEDVIMSYGQFLFSHKLYSEGRELLSSSIKALPKTKHIAVIIRFALLEFQYGIIERGRTILEGVLANYPNRVDVWSVFIDQEIKARSNVEAIRLLFQRATSLDLSSKKMKFFFKKYLKFERDHGDEESINKVKMMAKEYVQSKLDQS